MSKPTPIGMKQHMRAEPISSLFRGDDCDRVELLCEQVDYRVSRNLCSENIVPGPPAAET